MLVQKPRQTGEIIRPAPFRITQKRRNQRSILFRTRFAANWDERFLKDSSVENFLSGWMGGKLQGCLRWLDIRDGAVHLHTLGRVSPARGREDQEKQHEERPLEGPEALEEKILIHKITPVPS